MPIQVPRVRANLMINKELNKVQNEVKKASGKTLTGAVKVWCNLFKSGKEINEILKYKSRQSYSTGFGCFGKR